MEPTFTGFTLTVNQIALAIANTQQARARVGRRRHASPARDQGRPGTRATLAWVSAAGSAWYQGNPGLGLARQGWADPADHLAAAEHGHVGDPVQRMAVHPLAGVPADA